MKNIFVLTAISSMIGSAALAQGAPSAPAAPQPVVPQVSQDLTRAPQPQPAETQKQADKVQEAANKSTK